MLENTSHLYNVIDYYIFIGITIIAGYSGVIMCAPNSIRRKANHGSTTICNFLQITGPAASELLSTFLLSTFLLSTVPFAAVPFATVPFAAGKTTAALNTTVFISSDQGATGFAQPDTIAVRTLIDSSRAIYSSDLKQSLRTGLEALAAAEEIGYLTGKADALDNLATIYSRMGENRKAMAHLKQALELNRTLGNQRGIASNLVVIGGVYKRQSHYERALDHFYESLRICEQIDLENGIAANLGNIGLIYHEMAEYHRALDYYLRAERLNRETANSYLLAVVLNNIGLTYSNLGEFEKSLAYHYESLSLRKESGSTIGMAYSFNNIGKLRHLMGDHEAAMEALSKALERNDGQDPDLESIIHEHFARILLDTGDYEKAAVHARKSLDLSREFGTRLGEQEGYRLLSDIHGEKGDYHAALKYHRRLLDVRDSIFNDRMASRIEELRARYESEQREAQIALLEQQQQQDQLVRSALTAGVVLLLIMALLIFNRQKTVIRKNRIELENQRLKKLQLEQELDFKKRQLTSYSLHLVQKNELMKELSDKIHKIRSEKDNGADYGLKSLDNLIHYSFNLDEDWEEFRLYFEEVHPGFFDWLNDNCPNLTPNELRLCALLRLNLSSKEIASLLGISPPSVKIARYRLRKKLQLNTKESLTGYLMGMDTESNSNTKTRTP